MRDAAFLLVDALPCLQGLHTETEPIMMVTLILCYLLLVRVLEASVQQPGNDLDPTNRREVEGRGRGRTARYTGSAWRAQQHTLATSRL